MRVHLDRSGTLWIPDAIRRQLGIEAGALVILSVEGGQMVMRVSKLQECLTVSMGPDTIRTAGSTHRR